MSYSLTQKAIDIEGIPLAPKAVLVVLARHARDDGTNKRCPSVPTLAAKAGMQERATRSALRWLEAEGWIEPVSNKVGGRNQTTKYRVVIDRLGPDETRQDVPPLEPETRHDVPPNGHDTRQQMPPSATERGHEKHQKAAFNAPEYIREEIQIEDETDSRAPAHAMAVGERIAVLAGMAPDPKRDLTPVINWLKAGADPEQDIYPAVHLVLSRTLQTEIRRFGFFSAEVENFRAARTNLPLKAAANVHPIRPAPQQRRGLAGRAAWRDQSLAYLASVIEDED